jgi:hypothetical protein
MEIAPSFMHGIDARCGTRVHHPGSLRMTKADLITASPVDAMAAEWHRAQRQAPEPPARHQTTILDHQRHIVLLAERSAPRLDKSSEPGDRADMMSTIAAHA